MTYLHCPRCRFAIRCRAHYLMLTNCPRCLGRSAITSPLFTSSLNAIELSRRRRLGSAARREPPGEMIDPGTPSATRSRPRLLVAEDDATNRMLAVAMLDKLGYDADAVADGAAALEALSRVVYGAVLMDCRMPRMDGFEATRELRGREGGAQRTPIIAMTADAMPGDRERCLQAGMDDYLPKPIDMDMLAEILGRRLSDEKASRDAGAAAAAGAARGPAFVASLDLTGMSKAPFGSS